MKPVEIMLNFLRKKTSKRTDGPGKNSEPPIMIMSPEDNSSEYIRYNSRHSEDLRPRSEIFDRENGTVAYGDHFHSMHKSCSSSLDEVRFASIQTSPQGVYVKNRRKTSFCSGLDDSYSESQNGVLQTLNEEPAKLFHSPKFSQRLSSSHRTSGHSRSLSTIADASSRPVERNNAVSPLRSSVEVTPRLYRKNAQQKPLHVLSTDIDLNDSNAAEVSYSGSEGSQWSCWDNVRVSPVPPPRKKRSKGRDCESSQTSSSPETLNDVEPTRKQSGAGPQTEHTADPMTVMDSPEFCCNLPNDFSDLGLDILNMPSTLLSSSNEKSNFDLLQEIDDKRSDFLHHLECPVSPENCSQSKSRDILRSSDSKILNPESVSFDKNGSTSSFFDSSLDSVFQNNSTGPSKKSKLQSEMIVKSFFSKSQKQLDDFASKKNGEHKDNDSSAKDCEAFDLSQRNSSFATLESVFSSKIPEVHQNLKQSSRNHCLHFRENSSDDSRSDCNSESICSGEIVMNGVHASQPDVLIGTQWNVCSSSSFAKESAQALNSVHNSDLSTMKSLNCDLSVCHQLHGFPSATVVSINEKSTSKDVIEKILMLENISDNWFLYKLCTNGHDPKLRNDGSVELNTDDIPLRFLNNDNQRTTEGVQFELQRRDGISIQISCDASTEKPKTLSFEISHHISCRFVLEAAVKKFHLKCATKFCLIEVNRNRKELPMRRVDDSEVIAQLNSNYFLLCEKEFLFESVGILSRLPENLPWIKSLSQLSYLPPGSAFETEVDALKKKVNQLEMKLVESEKQFQRKLTKQQNRLDRYRRIAVCMEPNEKEMLLEEELNHLTEEMCQREQKIQIQKEICKSNSSLKENAKRLKEKLLSMESSFVKVTNERKEVSECLLKTAKILKQMSCDHCTSDLFKICKHSQGSHLYGFEIERSELSGVRLFPSSEQNERCLRVKRSNGCRYLSEGDRILEINGQLVLRLNEIELVNFLGKTTDKLRVVIMRDDVQNSNIKML